MKRAIFTLSSLEQIKWKILLIFKPHSTFTDNLSRYIVRHEFLIEGKRNEHNGLNGIFSTELTEKILWAQNLLAGAIV